MSEKPIPDKAPPDGSVHIIPNWDRLSKPPPPETVEQLAVEMPTR
jgi:hypothetical protein